MAPSQQIPRGPRGPASNLHLRTNECNIANNCGGQVDFSGCLDEARGRRRDCIDLDDRLQHLAGAALVHLLFNGALGFTWEPFSKADLGAIYPSQ